MMKHYFKIAIRTLARQKVLAFINVFGLSVGLACFTLFLLYAVNEFTFDRFHKNGKNIYRVYEWTQGQPGSEAQGEAGLYMPLGPAMKHDFPDVENYVRFQRAWDEKFVKTSDLTTQVPVSFADPQIFTVFTFKLVFGDPVNALADQRNVVVTRDKAIDLFGTMDVVGKTVEIKIEDKFEPFTVSAVAENIPSNSSIRFDILLSFDYLQTTGLGKTAVNNWSFSGFQNYILLTYGSSLVNDWQRLFKFRKKFLPDEEAQLKQYGMWDGKSPYPVSFKLQPLRDIHTALNIRDSEGHIDAKTVWMLLSIATGILMIACINFTTLAIGRSAGRSKEIGLRKVLGGTRKKLVFQFLIESLFLSSLSLLVGLMIAQILLPYFNELAGKELSFSFAQFPELIAFFGGIAILAGILSGIYPSLILSGFNPLESLNRKIKFGGSNIFTNSLVSIQFALSIVLIISTMIILQQLNFMRSKNPGFNKENIVVIDAKGTDAKNIYPLFKEQVASNSSVLGITASDIALGEEGYNSSGFDYNGKHPQIFHYKTSSDYINVTGMQLIAGRDFNPLSASDTMNSVIVNESLVTDLGLTNEKILGFRLKGYFADERRTPIVIGVVKNFNYFSLKEEIKPILFSQPADLVPSKFFVRIKPGNPFIALQVLNKAWKNIVADIPMKYSFLDDDLGNFYRNEIRLSEISGWAGGISIFLACIGLFGLTTLSVTNRTREIGIRKVLGASTRIIVQLLSKDFLKLVMLALLIATPLSWYFMNKWLQDYAYRIRIQWWVFATTAMGALLLALATVSLQAIKTARSNPVKSLRTE
ncbi:MAG TPA: ABC transporter permease [Chitinophagaceae bacterium]|nr:ABC transporter permease [Chitinophagaceae bacterium]